MQNIDVKCRIMGALIGCAYGDAMGMPTEMMTRENMDLLFPNGIREFNPSTSKDFIGRSFVAGEVTDDTINTLLVCESIIKNNGVFDTYKYLELLKEWINNNIEKNQYIIGPSTRKALSLMENGNSIDTAGIFGTTNGAAMKVSPIGFISDYNDMKSLVDNVEKLCLPTHNNNIAIAGASVIASIMSYVVRGGHDLNEIWDIAYEAIEEGSKRGFKLPGVSLKIRLQSMRELLDQNDKDSILFLLENYLGYSMETVDTIPAVIALLMLSEGKPLVAAELAANIAGDTDTIGAITTGICGAMYPLFVKKDIELLEKVNGINFGEVAENISKFVENNLENKKIKIHSI